jgi:fluoride ion exporter CrcB/FEX
VLFSGLAASLQMWVPLIFAPNSQQIGIDISLVLFNIIGCFIASICTAFKQVKHQYFQTYLMYIPSSPKMDFLCSILLFS